MNFLNVDQLNAALDRAAETHASQRIRAWLLGNFRNHVLRHGPCSRPSGIGRDAPQWAHDAFAQNALYELDVTSALEGLGEILDYLRHLDARGKDFSRMSVPDARRHQAAYHRRLAKAKEALVDEDGIETYLELDGGYRWVRVFGEQSLKREGQMMGHCVGDYYQSVASGRTVIYSLRDAFQRAHVTVEVATRRSEVAQIKSRANNEVPPKYRPHCLALLVNLQVASIDLDQSGLDPDEVRQHVHAEGRGTLGDERLMSLDVENRRFAEHGAHPIEVLIRRNDSVVIEGSSMATVFEELGADPSSRWFVTVQVPGLAQYMSLTYRAGRANTRSDAHLEFTWPNANDRKSKRQPGWKVYDRYKGFDVLYASLEALRAQGLLCESLPKTLLGRNVRFWQSDVAKDILTYLRSTLRRQDLCGWAVYSGNFTCMHHLAWSAGLAVSGNAFLARPGDEPNVREAIWFTLGKSMVFEAIPAELPPGAAEALAQVRGQRRVLVRNPSSAKALAQFLAALGTEPQGRAEASALLTLLSVRRRTVLSVVEALNQGDASILAKTFPDRPMPKVWSADYSQIAHSAGYALYVNAFQTPVASALCALLSDRPPLSDPKVRQGLTLLARGKTASRYAYRKERIDSAFTALRVALPSMLPLTDADLALFDAEGARALRKLYRR